MSRTHAFRLEFPSRFEELEVVDKLIEAFLERLGVAEDDRSNLALAVREAGANAVLHGNRNDESLTTTVTVTLEDRELGVKVADKGAGFDPEAVPDPLAPENLLKPTGRGILLMRNFMDDVAFEFPESGGTVVAMRKALPDGDDAGSSD